jgi:hypothetical protein
MVVKSRFALGNLLSISERRAYPGGTFSAAPGDMQVGLGRHTSPKKGFQRAGLSPLVRHQQAPACLLTL